MNVLLMHPFSCYEKLESPHLDPTACHWVGTQTPFICPLILHLHTQWDIDQFTMVLAFNNDYIIYYHMDATQSVGVAQTCFSNAVWWSKVGSAPPLYFLTELTNWSLMCIVKFFLGRMGYTPVGAPCDCIITVIGHFNVVMSFVISTFLFMNCHY